MKKKTGKVFPEHMYRTHKQASGKIWKKEDMQTFALSPDDMTEVKSLVDAINDIRLADGAEAFAECFKCVLESAAVLEDLILSGRTNTTKGKKS